MSSTFNVNVHKVALDTLIAHRWTRHLLSDGEPDGGRVGACGQGR
ncbi:MAG: hypothetical protein ACM359_17600 [Bacillota bacterium]